MTPDETACCAQSEKKAPLTDQILGKLDSLIMQSSWYKTLVNKLRDVLGIYNPNAWLSSAKQAGTPEVPVTPTISDAARRMTRLIQDNEETLMDFENLLKNL